MKTKTQKETSLDFIRTTMRRVISTCGQTRLGKVIIGGEVRMFINPGVGDGYAVFERMDDNILRHASFQNGIKQASMIPNADCSDEEWEMFLNEATVLAGKFGVPIVTTQEP